MNSEILDYYNKNGKGTKLKELLNSKLLRISNPKAMLFFGEIKLVKEGQEKNFSGKLLIFTKNSEFKKHVESLIKPIKIIFPQCNLNDIDGRLEYLEKIFLELDNKSKNLDKRQKLVFEMLLMYIAKVYKVCYKLRESIKTNVEKQRMAGNTLEELHNNFKIVEPLIRSDFEKVFGQDIDKTGYPFAIKSNDSIAAKIHMAQERFFKNQGYTDLQACKKSVIDAIRYTVLYTIDVYEKNYENSITKLKKEGYICIRCRNFWKDSGSYNGLNVLFSSPYGYFVEVQFHTPESKNLNFATHKLYEELRKPEISNKRKTELEKEMQLMESEYKNDEKLVEKIKNIKDFELSEIVWSLPPE